MAVTYDLTNPTTTGLVKITNLITSLSSLTLDKVGLTNEILSFSTTSNVTSMATMDLAIPTYGHKYYGRCYQKAPAGFTSGDGRFEYYAEDVAGTGLLTFCSMQDTNNEWKMFSSIQELTGTPTGTNWKLRSFVVNGNSECYRKELMIIDLTDTFGTGNEPSKEWCDKNILSFYGATYMVNGQINKGDIITCPYSGTNKIITLPKGKYKLEVWGAQGGSYQTFEGGYGGYSYGTLELTESTSLFLCAGGQPATVTTSRKAVPGGFNGGGNGFNRYYNSTYTYGQGGGGGSDIRIKTDSLYARVIVAGGGGGSASEDAKTTKMGGGLSGIAPQSGYGATQTTGGSSGTKGTFGQGANTTTSRTNYKYGSGGGGGGWYGGAAASSASDNDTSYRGQNGGGSGYIYTESTAANYPSGCLLTSKYYLTDASTAISDHGGNGLCKITALRVEGDIEGEVNLGNNSLKKIYYGNGLIKKIYLGNTQIL